MIRFNRQSRTLIIRLPGWRDRRWWWALVLFVLFDLTFSFVDRPVAMLMADLSPPINAFFGKVTLAGDSKYYLVPLVLVLPFIFAARLALEDGALRRILGWLAQTVGFFFIAIAGSGLLVNLLKGIIGRARPKLFLHDGVFGFEPFTFGKGSAVFQSMPSGHTNTAFALATALGFFFPRLRGWFWALAAFIGFSRVALTAHYPTDVIVGGALGILTTYWLRRVCADKGWVFVRRHGQYKLGAPGVLLGSKIRAFLYEKLGLPDGIRGRLP